MFWTFSICSSTCRMPPVQSSTFFNQPECWTMLDTSKPPQPKHGRNFEQVLHVHEMLHLFQSRSCLAGLLRGHAATEEGCRGEVAAVAGVRSAHPGTSDSWRAQGLEAVRQLLGDVEPRSMFLASNICWVSSGTCRRIIRDRLLCKTSLCKTSCCIHIGTQATLERQPRFSESGTVRARYCCDPREVSGAKPVMKKCKPVAEVGVQNSGGRAEELQQVC